MKISKTDSLSKVQSFKANDTEVNDNISSKEIIDGKKKLALALGGLATIGAVAVGTAIAVKNGKTTNVNNSAKKVTTKIKKATKDIADDIPIRNNSVYDKALDVRKPTPELMINPPEPFPLGEKNKFLKEIKETVKVQDGKFVFSRDPKMGWVDLSGDYLGTSVLPLPTNTAPVSKYLEPHLALSSIGKHGYDSKQLLGYKYSTVDGQQIVRAKFVKGTAHKKNGVVDGVFFEIFPSNIYEKEINLTTGVEKLIPRKILGSEKGGLIRKTSADGITMKNGKEFAKRTIKTNAKGDKLIHIQYMDGYNPEKAILIGKDGTKQVASFARKHTKEAEAFAAFLESFNKAA